MTAPITRGSFGPNRLASRPATGAETSIISEDGSRKRPACVTVEPKPYPADVGVSTNWGMSTNEPYIPTPRRTAARFVVQTPRRRIICMSTSGVGRLASIATQTTATTTAAASRPMRAGGEPAPAASPR